MSEKKVVGRVVAIGLGIICILLAVGLVGVFAYYTMTLNNKNSAYDDYVSGHSHSNSDYDSLNSQKNDCASSHSHSNSDYDSLKNQNTNLQNQVNDLTSNLKLEKSTVWVDDQTISQPASSYTEFTFSASYAGYLSVLVHSSTTDKTYVQLVWSTPGIGYDKKITVGVGGEAAFPVLPSSLTVRVGNTNYVNGATETITITYHY